MSMWREALVIFILLFVGIWVGKAKGQSKVPCIDKEIGQQNLAKAGERPAFIGLSNRGHITTIFMNENTQVWTATYITPDGKLCVVDAGGFGKTIRKGKEASYDRQ